MNRAGLLLLLALSGCGSTVNDATTTRPTAVDDERPPVDATTRPAPAASTVFGFLLERYDRDGDGRLTAAEYGRSARDFALADRDGNGVLDAADFGDQGRRARGARAEDERRLRGALLSVWFLQDDESPERFDLDEFRRGFRAYDADGNGRVGRREFEAIVAERSLRGTPPPPRWAGLLERETTDPWERLVVALDRDDDGFVTLSDVEVFHRAEESRATWSDISTALVRPRQARLGEPAPDFDLETVEGERRYHLADFAARGRPVALVFGSYT